ncbi:MAG: YidC/Oxa1 family insertase periplasmic-domain containing protein [Fibrobacteraceae bacterium]
MISKNTIIGAALLGGLLIWSMTMSVNQAGQQTQAQTKQEAVKAENPQKPVSLTLPSKGSTHPGAVVLAGNKPAEIAPLDTGKLKSAELAATTDTASAQMSAKVQPEKITVENDKFIAVLDNDGAKISSITVKTLKDSAGHFPEIIQDTVQGALSLKLDDADLSSQLFATDAPAYIKVAGDTSVTFTFSDVNGNQVIRKYSFTAQGMTIGHVTHFKGFAPKDYEVSWNGGMRETERFPKGKSFGGASYFFSEVIFNNLYSVDRETVREKKKFNDDNGKILWAGLRRKYVAAVIKFPEASEATLVAEPLKAGDMDPKDPGTYKISLSDEIHDDSLSFDFLVLPLQWKEIAAFENCDFEKIIVSGWSWCGADVWFVALCGFLLWLLKAFYSIIPNYGVAIILLTILVRIITTPLTVKQLRSTKEMSKIKPELDAINVKYRAEPRKKQAAVMELYAKHNINPMASCTGGCLPMLIQMPIFIGLFIVLGRAIELRGMPFIGWISDLSSSDVVWHGFSIPYLMPDGLAILPVIMVFTTYFQTKQSMVAMTDPAQKKMMTWMMPAMMFLFSAVMPSGLVLYWIVSNLWGIAQYWLINRKQDAPLPANVQEAHVVKVKKPKK